MQRKWVVLVAGALLGTMLTGCMERQGDLGNRNIREKSVRFDANGNRIWNKRFADDQMNEMNRVDGRRLNSNNIIGSHANYRIEMSKEIADRVAAMKEVNKAYVMLTDSNAYVAVSLSDGTNGMAMKSVSPAVPLSRTSQAYYRPGVLHPRELHNNSVHLNNDVTPDRMHKTMTFDTMHHANYSGYAAPFTGHSYASSDVATGLKDKIALEVQRMAPQIKNVYVSANPDFLSRMTSYMEDVRLGHPIQGFVAEFNAMVERIFPARAGINR